MKPLLIAFLAFPWFAGIVSSQEMYFFETVKRTSNATIENGKLIRTQEIKIEKPPRSGPVQFTNDAQASKSSSPWWNIRLRIGFRDVSLAMTS